MPQFAPGAGIHHIIGLNGSGKSTLLKLLSGVLSPHRGEILFAGHSITEPSTFRQFCRDSGYLWQNFRLRGGVPTRTYLEYRAWLHGIESAQIREVALRALAAVELSEAAEKAIGRLSGGMQRRVGIAAETLHLPGLLLLDEPSSGLDYHARDLLYVALERLVSADSTIITVAHEPDELSRYDSTVHVMANGTLATRETFRAGEITSEVLRELTEGAQR
ncbi:ATP-binding cassette domain-containing protein [uncultured Cellulomonas sp.]|uniref:ATP-binding cassette domain-containing protein n=1 Tax=uncultured Cellulomonas sp. TaxID=189682 RepID=UPI00261FA9E0|nr:ATP-binding cassette domain-containing protein [uncultured Cellulomonas sp.]